MTASDLRLIAKRIEEGYATIINRDVGRGCVELFVGYKGKNMRMVYNPENKHVVTMLTVR